MNIPIIGSEFGLESAMWLQAQGQPVTFMKKRDKRGSRAYGDQKVIFNFLLTLAILLSPLTGCSFLRESQESTKSQPEKSEQGITPVDVAIARLGFLEEVTSYIGTTKPVQEVSVRSQVEGRLLNLNVDVGDRVTQGQILGKLDDTLLATAVSQGQAELAALQSELARTQAQVNNARIQLERARVELQQAENDAARYTELAEIGGISQREAETFQTAAKVAQKAVLSAQEQIRTEEQAVAAALGRVGAQKAVIAQAQQRQSYARLISPITGVVLEKVSEPGNLISPGDEVLKIGDFSRVKVVVPVSELDLSNIRVRQSVEVKLDAFAQKSFAGKVSRISPVADSTARQVPVEVTIPNPNNQIGSGLLARVSFQSISRSRVVVPQSAVIGEGSLARVFVITNQEEGKQAQVEKREVKIGNSANGKVEIISGIEPGERFVIRSGKPLADGETVRLSILSE
ncbi:MAG: efflux RND transporter periplasmic adaptor subunit [Xenococcaceae cyanobacterium]